MANRRIAAHVEMVDRQIVGVMISLNEKGITPEQYNERLEQIEKLAKIRNDLISSEPTKTSIKIDPNVVISGGFSFALALLVVTHEQENIITTKMMPLVMKWLGR